jgi:hypothetical protein
VILSQTGGATLLKSSVRVSLPWEFFLIRRENSTPSVFAIVARLPARECYSHVAVTMTKARILRRAQLNDVASTAVIVMRDRDNETGH